MAAKIKTTYCIQYFSALNFAGSFAAMQKFLVIQTAFIGDVVLATALLEKLHTTFPTASIDLLVRAGNETLFTGHPFLRNVLVWVKKKNKYTNLLGLLTTIRKEKYDRVINLQRFGATGLLTIFSGARCTVGFNKNPFSRFFTRRLPHQVGSSLPYIHEVERNQLLIADITGGQADKPRLYPTQANYQAVKPYQTQPYICIAPASVWFTKQYPADKWIAFAQSLPQYTIYLLGAPSDRQMADTIAAAAGTHVINLAAKLSFLEFAALQQGAVMNYVNDSAPLHFASAVNAPVTAVYCSTVPAFGFGPLAAKSYIVETTENLSCRPCGLHGYQACPLTHFKCAHSITNAQLLATLPTQ